jgi:tRNA-dihydrouridine synthase B
MNVLLKHFELMKNCYGEEQGTVLMRKHACWYTKGLKEGGEFRAEINQVSDQAVFRETIERYFHSLSQNAPVTL